MKITETETESELKKVEQTTTVEKIKCDVCGHAYTTNEWEGNEFSVNPGIERESNLLSELDDLFDSYHTSVPKHVVDDGYDGHEMKFDVPKKQFLEVLKEEIELAVETRERSRQEQLSIQALKQDYADKIGTNNFYLMDGEIHHFRYVLNVEASTQAHKHVCDDCFDVIFD